MSVSTTAHGLSEAIGQATRSARFCVTGCLPEVSEAHLVIAVKLPGTSTSRTTT
jgi:hypothetical protein